MGRPMLARAPFLIDALAMYLVARRTSKGPSFQALELIGVDFSVLLSFGQTERDGGEQIGHYVIRCSVPCDYRRAASRSLIVVNICKTSMSHRYNDE